MLKYILAAMLLAFGATAEDSDFEPALIVSVIGNDTSYSYGPFSPLVEARNIFAGQLTDSAVVTRLWRLTEAEVGTQGENAAHAFIESVFNRAHARGQTLLQAMNDEDYYPSVSIRGIDPPTERVVQYALLLDQVRAGSNIANYATGNASGDVGFNRGPKTYATAGERFGIEGPDMPWAESIAKGEIPMSPPPMVASAKPVAKKVRVAQNNDDDERPRKVATKPTRARVASRDDDEDRPRKVMRKASRDDDEDDDRPRRRRHHRDDDDGD